MTRTVACFSISFSLWLATAGIAAGQAMGEAAGLGAMGATAASGAKGVGKSMSGIAGAFDKAVNPAGASKDAGAVTAPKAKVAPKATARAAKPDSKAAPTTVAAEAAVPAPPPAPKFEDPDKLETGLAYEELVRRFGPPTMMVTSTAERTLFYQTKDGMFQLKLRDGLVASVDKPQR